MTTAPRCTACGHLALLHAPIGSEPAEGDRCVTCQCTGLVRERDESNSADERAEGGAACAE
jgi:hypothetical protein